MAESQDNERNLQDLQHRVDNLEGRENELEVRIARLETGSSAGGGGGARFPSSARPLSATAFDRRSETPTAPPEPPAPYAPPAPTPSTSSTGACPRSWQRPGSTHAFAGVSQEALWCHRSFHRRLPPGPSWHRSASHPDLMPGVPPSSLARMVLPKDEDSPCENVPKTCENVRVLCPGWDFPPPIPLEERYSMSYLYQRPPRYVWLPGLKPCCRRRGVIRYPKRTVHISPKVDSWWASGPYHVRGRGRSQESDDADADADASGADDAATSDREGARSDREGTISLWDGSGYTPWVPSDVAANFGVNSFTGRPARTGVGRADNARSQQNSRARYLQRGLPRRPSR